MARCVLKHAWLNARLQRTGSVCAVGVEVARSAVPFVFAGADTGALVMGAPRMGQCSPGVTAPFDVAVSATPLVAVAVAVPGPSR